MDVILTFITATLLPLLLKILIALLIYFIGKKLISVVLNLTKKGMEKARLDAGVQSFIESALKIVLYIVLIFAIVGYLGVATSSVAALFASAGVTVGLALQGSLSNLAGGVLILVLKPFKVGDFIIAAGVEGTVSAIEIFYTKLLTTDNKLVTIPNGALSNGNIINASHEELRRVDFVFGVAYESDLKLVKSILETVGARHELVLQNDEEHPITVFINEFGASSIDFGFRVWCRNENYWTVKWELMENVKAAFDANNIEIPFNQLDVNMKNQ